MGADLWTFHFLGTTIVHGDGVTITVTKDWMFLLSAMGDAVVGWLTYRVMRWYRAK